jgi:hypothetical protein
MKKITKKVLIVNSDNSLNPIFHEITLGGYQAKAWDREIMLTNAIDTNNWQIFELEVGMMLGQGFESRQKALEGLLKMESEISRDTFKASKESWKLKKEKYDIENRNKED